MTFAKKELRAKDVKKYYSSSETRGSRERKKEDWGWGGLASWHLGARMFL